MNENDMNGSMQELVNTSEMEGKYLTFVTENQLFGIPIADVVQIVGVQDITQIPEFPSYAKGIINLRGSIIPVIDVRLRFSKPERVYDERTCIIVTLINDTSVGFIVDEVDAVTDIATENVSQPPKIAGEVQNTYVTGIAKHEGRVILLLNVGKLLSNEDFEVLIAQE
ncbi:MAG: chemotaxis protein CheW [Oscillospiraceae bacterium]